MEPIGDEIRRELRRFGVQGALPAIVAAWPDAVGETIARNAWPARLGRDGSLYVSTSSSVWAFELSHLAAVVLERLEAMLGQDAPRGMRFAPGPIPEPPLKQPPEVSKRSNGPSPEMLAEAASLASGIDDEELRDRVAKAAAWSLERARSDRRF